MKAGDPPCRMCQDRHPACWSDCRRYQDWREKRSSAKSQEESSKHAFSLLRDGVTKALRNSHRSRRK